MNLISCCLNKEKPCWYPGRASSPALPAPVSQEPAVETRCFAQIILCNYLDYLLFTLVETPAHAEHGVCASLLPALAKNTRREDREIKKKAFSAFWLSCSGNPRNLGARMCIDRSGALQAAAGLASSSPSSRCIRPRGRMRHHQPPLKKRGDKIKHGAVTLPQSSSSTRTPLKSQCCKWGTEGLGFCRAGVEVSGLGKEGSFPHPPAGSFQSCELPHRFQSHFVLWAVPGLAVLHTVICRPVLPPAAQREFLQDNF